MTPADRAWGEGLSPTVWRALAAIVLVTAPVVAFANYFSALGRAYPRALKCLKAGRPWWNV